MIENCRSTSSTITDLLLTGRQRDRQESQFLFWNVLYRGPSNETVESSLTRPPSNDKSEKRSGNALMRTNTVKSLLNGNFGTTPHGTAAWLTAFTNDKVTVP